MSADQHNAALLPIFRLIFENAPDEADQWVLLESLCLGIGHLNGRDARETAIFVEYLAERLVAGERGK